MPSPRYTIRLPESLHILVQEYIRTTDTPFAVLIREALTAYLADSALIGAADPADSADTLRAMQDELAALRARVEALELALTTVPTPRRQDADSDADHTLPAGRGQRKLTPRQIRALRDKYQRGVPVPALQEEYGISRASVFRYLQSEKREGR
jgi:hypothetical protein